MMMPKLNGKAPNFSLPDTNGKILSLHETLGDGQTTLLIFLRHLG